MTEHEHLQRAMERFDCAQAAKAKYRQPLQAFWDRLCWRSLLNWVALKEGIEL